MIKESTWHLLKSNKYSQNMQIDLCYHELDRGVEGWPMEHIKWDKNGQNSKTMFCYGNSKNRQDMI